MHGSIATWPQGDLGELHELAIKLSGPSASLRELFLTFSVLSPADTFSCVFVSNVRCNRVAVSVLDRHAMLLYNDDTPTPTEFDIRGPEHQPGQFHQCYCNL